MAFETPPTNPEEKEALREQIRKLEQQLAEKEAKIAGAEKTAQAELERMYTAGELERPVEPKQSGWDEAPDIRKALRNMRNTDEVQAWYQYARGIFDDELLTETIMQGVWSDVRKSEKFDSGFKEDMRIKKRQYVMHSGDLTMGFSPNVTKKIYTRHAAEMDSLRKDANKRLTLQGPEAFFQSWDQLEWVDDDGKRHRDAESLEERYQKLIVAYNEANPGDKVEDSMDKNERRSVMFNAGMKMYDQISQNLADDEFTLMPGMLRGLYVVMRNMEVSSLSHYSKRDLDVKIPMVEFFIQEFKNAILGKREMSRENGLLFIWFVNQAGQSFIPFESIGQEYKDWYEIIKALVGRPRDVRAGTSIYPKLQDENERKKVNNAVVMKRINELRAAKGLPPMTVDEHPFARIGVGK